MSSIARRLAIFGGTSDPDVRFWRSAAIANGGSVSVARLAVVATFVAAEKASGAWALTDDYWGLWGENAPQALTSIKQRRLASAVNSPAFVVDRGYTGDALSSYIDTLFNPATHGVAMTGTDMQMSWYERTNIQDNSFIGLTSSGSRTLRGRSRSTSNQARLDINSTGSTIGGVNDSRGLWSFQRATGPAWGISQNSVDLGATVPTSLSTSLAPDTLPVLGHKTSGVVDNFAARQLGFFAVGASLSAPQRAARFAAVNVWATAIGANVV